MRISHGNRRRIARSGGQALMLASSCILSIDQRMVTIISECISWTQDSLAVA